VDGNSEPIADLLEEGTALLEAAAEAGLHLKAVGGLAVRITCPSAAHPPLRREYKDIDLVGLGRERQGIDAVLTARGYAPDTAFNTHHGATRLKYDDPVNGRGLDVFLDRLTMCHELDLRRRLNAAPLTLDTADLLLSKLQIVETNERDFKDATALLADGAVDQDRVAEVLATDWGWWRTSTEVLGKIETYAAALPDAALAARAGTAITGLKDAIERRPKSLRWKARARVGDRVRWYESPEEVEAG
jgi:hypothetical protein